MISCGPWRRVDCRRETERDRRVAEGAGAAEGWSAGVVGGSGDGGDVGGCVVCGGGDGDRDWPWVAGVACDAWDGGGAASPC